MARDRQRAKARKARRAAQSKDSGNPITGGAAHDLPGTDHLSGEVDGFEAQLVSDAGGEPAGPDVVDALEHQGALVHPEALSDDDFAALEDSIDDVEEAFESGNGDEIERAERAELDLQRKQAAAPPGAPTPKGPGRTIAFLRASWAELQRVQWPDRRQVGQATAVVLGFVVVAGLYLGLADAVAKKIVDIII